MHACLYVCKQTTQTALKRNELPSMNKNIALTIFLQVINLTDNNTQETSVNRYAAEFQCGKLFKEI